MPTYRSRPQDRRPPPPLTAVGRASRSARDTEAILLAASLLVVILGLFLTHRTHQVKWQETANGLNTGAVIDLSELDQPEELLDVLSSFTDPTERRFVAQQLWRHLTESGQRLDNVGQLATVRVSADDLGDATLPILEARLAAQAAAAPERTARVRLLSDAQLAEIKPRLVVRRPGVFLRQSWTWFLLAAVAAGLVHWIWRRNRRPFDPLILPLVTTLSGLGLILMTSIWDPLRDTAYHRNFAQGMVAGLLLLAIISLVDFERPLLRRLAFPALLGAFGLSALLILFGSGPRGSDAKVNLFGAQPVEVIKVLAVLFFAGYFHQRWEMLREIRESRGWFSRLPQIARLPKLEYVLPPLVAMGVFLVLFFLQRDLGPALILSLLFLCLYGVAQGRPLMVISGLAIIVAGFTVGHLLETPRTVSSRISMWLAPWDNGVFGGDHLASGFWALASGGLTGTGLGLGQPRYVPAVHTDMVLVALGEELGFLGLVVTLALYGLLFQRCLRSCYRAASTYSYFLALGLTLLLALPLILVTGGVLGLLPLTGVVTPFASYGRSASLVSFVIVGALASISAQGGTGETTRYFHRATRLVGLAFFGALTLLALRLGQLQVVDADRTATRGALALHADGVLRYRYNPRLLEAAALITRGTIRDRNGIPLAVNHPDELTEAEAATIQTLGGTTEASLTDGGDRFYPFGGTMFHLLGDLRTQVNWTASNTSFLERDERLRLQGYDDRPSTRLVRQPDGSQSQRITRDYRELLPLLRHRNDPDHPAVRRLLERDRDVVSTIDIRLQIRLAQALAQRAAAHEGAGAAVVLDVPSGEILASVSAPWPERQPVASTAGVEPLIDRVRYGIYPPGSTFKIVTAVAALRKNPALAEQSFQCIPLSGRRVGHPVRGWGRPIRDDPTVRSPHGEVDLVEGIRVSCNAYFAQLGTYEVGAASLLETAALLDIPVAQPNTPEQLADALPQATYGQGQVIATPFQMMRVAALIADGGNLPEIHWTRGEEGAQLPGEPLLGKQQTERIALAMRQVVTRGSGSRVLADVEPPVAGKTGTAEVAGERSHSWFIGFAPAGTEPPRVAFAVVVEHAGYGGQAAAQVVAELMSTLSELNYFDRSMP